MTEESIIKRIANAQRKAKAEGHAYRMGLDCALNGATMTNCSFAIFATPDNTKEWERGKRVGEQLKATVA